MNSKNYRDRTNTARVTSKQRFSLQRFYLYQLLALTLLLLFANYATAQKPSLNSIEIARLPGNGVQILMQLSSPPGDPLVFVTENPARIALDLPNTTLRTPGARKTVGIGVTTSVSAVEGKNRTRVVTNLLQLAPYKVTTNGNQVILAINGSTARTVNTTAPGVVAGTAINNIDFRRGRNGEGRLIINLADSKALVDTRESGTSILVKVMGASAPQQMRRALDVIDFATPVTSFETKQVGGDVHIKVNTTGPFETMAYQSDNYYSLDVKPLTEKEVKARKETTFSGEKISLNFQDIEVRSVLQLLADFTGFNLVTSDTVTGNITLRLKNVPWDQALDIILQAKGLGKRQRGNVMLVAPGAEIVAREQSELEAQKQIENLAPLVSEFVEVSYAKASDLASLLKTSDNSLLSERGSVSVDARTNTLLLRDTRESIENARQLVSQLDRPVRQVMIDSRLVTANDDFNRSLGVRWGLAGTDDGGAGADNGIAYSGFTEGIRPSTETVTIPTFNDGGFQTGTSSFDRPINPSGSLSINDTIPAVVDLAASGASSGFILSLLNISNHVLDLELTALETEGKGQVISNPRVLTTDRTQATIAQGSQIPFQEASSSGAAAISFQNAVLSLNVTPQITPDDNIILDLAVTNDTIGGNTAAGPLIDTTSINTQALVEDGQTVVLGGIYSAIRSNSKDKVPLLGDIPYLGALFRRTRDIDENSELLIFVTPQIVRDIVSGR